MSLSVSIQYLPTSCSHQAPVLSNTLDSLSKEPLSIGTTCVIEFMFQNSSCQSTTSYEISLQISKLEIRNSYTSTESWHIPSSVDKFAKWTYLSSHSCYSWVRWIVILTLSWNRDRNKVLLASRNVSVTHKGLEGSGPSVHLGTVFFQRKPHIAGVHTFSLSWPQLSTAFLQGDVVYASLDDPLECYAYANQEEW